MIGRTIGNYVVRDKIGEGGMGVVYRAEHPRINRRVAIKVLHPGADRQSEMVHRFFNEAKAATEIRNDHIVEVLDFGELPEGMPYLVMEWLEGQSLGELLRVETKLPVARAARIVCGIARALGAAHAKGVVHRDLKPDNVFLVQRNGDPDFVKVLDFGIAKLTSASASAHYRTQTGAIIGTPAYMSPEQCRGAKEIDQRTDVYSLGVIGYQMLTGSLPFNAEALGELLFQHLSQTPIAPAALEPSVPGAVSAIIAGTLEKDPNKRPSLVELAATMDLAITGGGREAIPAVDLAPVVATGPTLSAVPIAHTTLGSSAAQLAPAESPRSPTRRAGWVIAAVLAAGAAVSGMAVLIHKSSAGESRAGSPSSSASVGAPAATLGSVGIPVDPVEIRIRTDPPDARLTVDHRPVDNPYLTKTERDSRAREVDATLPGFEVAQGKLVFDRDRELVLKLTPLTTHGPTPGAAVEQRTATKRPHSSAEGVPRTRASSPEHPLPDAPGYHGSKLKIETEFP
jgi:serine/threonine protein kinase